MIGLIKSTHHYAKLESLKDFSRIAEMAFQASLAIPAIPRKAGYKTIDKLSEKLLGALSLTWESFREIQKKDEYAGLCGECGSPDHKPAECDMWG